MNRSDYDIVIVGAAMVGQALAAALAPRRELRIALVDAAPAPSFESEWDARVVALSERSMSFLQCIQAWEGISRRRVCPYRSMYVWDHEGTAHIEFQAADLHRETLGWIVENRVLVQALAERLEGLRHIQRLPTEVEAVDFATSDGEPHRLLCRDGSTLQSPLIIAADGALSSVRTMAALPTREWDYRHQAIVCTLRLEGSHEFCAWQRFARSGPLAFLPLTREGTDSNTVSIVWSLEDEEAERVMALDNPAFYEELETASEGRFGAFSLLDQRVLIPLRQRHAKHYYRSGLALIGDAAHTLHPLAGQGANLGFYDAAALAEEIERACARTVPLSDPSILQRYQRQRQAHNLLTMAGMEGFKRLFGSDDLALRFIRNRGMHYLNRAPLLKKWMARAAAGASLHG